MEQRAKGRESERETQIRPKLQSHFIERKSLF